MDESALAEAIQRAQRGDADGFDRLVDAYGPRLHGFVFRLTGSRQEAEDMVQDVFVRLVRMIPAYEHQGRFEPWLFRIAANLVRDRVRRLRRSPGVVGGSAGSDDGDGASAIESAAASDEGVERRMVLGEEVDSLNAALTALPEAEREVILLRHYSQMSFKEIADATGVPLGTALARGHRGLAKLRRLIEAAETDALNDRPKAAKR